MRTFLSRLLLLALLGVSIVAAVRLGGSRAGAVVAFDGVGAERLEWEGFALDAPGTFAIDAAGSFEEPGTDASDTTLAAYAWIARRSDGAVVWRLRAPRPERGTFVAVRDTIALPAGEYEAFFASFGDPLVRDPGPRDGSLRERIRSALSRGGRAWMGDAGRWRFILTGVDDGGRAARSTGRLEGGEDAPPDTALVWRAHRVENQDRRETLVQVTAPVRVRVRALSEVAEGVVADVGSITRLGPRDTVWTLGPGGRWAGGSLKNRVLEDEVALEPGLYRIAYETDRSHAYGGWEANPPFAPWQWGLEVRSLGPAGAIVPLEPSTLDLPRITGFDCVGPDNRREAVFTLPAPTDVLVVSVGEVTSGSRYDYGGLDRDDDGDWDEVWEMQKRGLDAAGGASKNRRAIDVLSLEAGTYRLWYETDGSHDCESGYNSGGGPSEPLWGAVVYALDPAFDVGAVQRSAPRSPGLSAAVPVPRGPLLARIDSVGDDERRTASFTLDAPREVLVVAAGEISSSARYDYGTITDAAGRTVWDMTWANTVHGGGTSLNRRYEGVVALPAGTYTVRYRTDGSRSFGEDVTDGPDDPSLWGVRVFLADGDVEGGAPPAPPKPPPPPDL